MSDTREGGGGSTPWLAFLVGALVVVVAIIAVFMYTGRQKPSVPETVDVNISPPAASAPATPSAE